MNTDSWIAPTIPGYDEIKQFYVKMAKQMDWVPGAVMSGMANSNVQLGMTEVKKNNAKINGIPLLQTVSMTMGANGVPAAGASAQAPPAAQAPPPPAPAQEPTSAKDAIASGIAGHFGLGGFGKKKKKTEDPPPADSSTAATPGGSGSATPAAAPATPGALMEMTIEVTSYSADTLDKSLFDVPAGYALVQSDFERKTARP
jgi:hypothetical protein